MKKLFAIIITLAAVLFTGCTKGDQELLRAVPEDAEVLARIDMKAALKSMGYSWSDVFAMATKSSKLKDGDCGIDMTGTAYAFANEKCTLNGIVLPVSDAEALRTYLSNNEMTVTETDGIYQVSGNLAFDKKRLVIAAGKDATAFNLHSLLKQEGIDDDVEELNEQLDAIEDPIAIVIDCDIIKKQAGRNVTTGMAMATVPLKLEDLFLTIGIDATENSAIISTNIVAEDSEAQDQLENIKKLIKPIKDEKIPFVADKYVALIAANIQGSDLKPYAAMLGGLETDPLFDAIKGLATFTLTGIDISKSKPAFTFTAQATNMTCMDKLMEQLIGFGLPINPEGHHTWTIADGQGDNVLVGAQGGYIFANYGNNMQRPKGDNTIHLEDGTVGYVHVKLSQIPELASYGVEEIKCYVTDELTTQTTITLTRTWKEIIEKK